VTLKALLQDLVDRRGWEDLAQEVPIRCFSNEPSLRSSLKFLRKTPWARAKVEALYLADQARMARRRKQNQRRKDRRQAALDAAGDPRSDP
jgi:uncharacterized protein (DUF2132 family)